MSPKTLVAACSVASILPLFLYWDQFRTLFYYHDDLQLLLDLSNSSPLPWIFRPFVDESIFPLFKALWISAVWVFGGSYMALIGLQWATHLGICLAFGWLLLRLHAPPLAAGFAVLTFGLASTNLETLGWSMQWCSQLSLLFFLLAWHLLVSILEGKTRIREYILYIACIVASTLCSSRGIVCGLLLGVFTLLAGGRRRMKLVTASVVPTFALVVITWVWVPVTRPSHVGAVAYALHYLAMNPLYRLFFQGNSFKETGVVILCGALKAVVIALAFYKSSRRLYPLLIALLVFDVATAAALGYARAWTDISTVFSSRYQYIPLLTFGPMLGIVVAGWRKGVLAVAAVLWIGILTYHWGGDIHSWVFGRGLRIRQAIAIYPPNAPFDPSRITAGRARQLAEQFHLH